MGADDVQKGPRPALTFTHTHTCISSCSDASTVCLIINLERVREFVADFRIKLIRVCFNIFLIIINVLLLENHFVQLFNRLCIIEEQMWVWDPHPHIHTLKSANSTILIVFRVHNPNELLCLQPARRCNRKRNMLSSRFFSFSQENIICSRSIYVRNINISTLKNNFTKVNQNFVNTKYNHQLCNRLVLIYFFFDARN